MYRFYGTNHSTNRTSEYRMLSVVKYFNTKVFKRYLNTIAGM